MKKIIVAIISMIFLAGLVSEAFLVSAMPTDKEDLEKITFIHYKDGKVKAIDSKAKPETNVCYKLMGVKWNTLPVSYVINPTNPQGLTPEFVTTAISTSAETWDAFTSKNLFSDFYGINYSAQYGVQDYKNALVFRDYSDNRVIAVTSVWYTRGPNKQIVEFDMLFNTRFNWGDATLNSSKMDLQNIATHELGHSAGLSDLYNSCIQETMYGYSWEGDISKRDLNSGDIAGLRAIYGA